MKSGSIVTVENFEFLDGFVDNENYQRKCIVLFKEEKNDEEYVYLCPIVSQLASFNKNPDNYYLLPLTNKKCKKLYFAKLNSVVVMKKEEIIDIVDWLDTNSIKRILEKIKNKYESYKNEAYYNDIVSKIK